MKSKEYIVISISDFESSVKKGNRYQGLVDGIGYVYWKEQEVYFIKKDYQTYQQILNPWFGYDKSKTVILKLYILYWFYLARH